MVERKPFLLRLPPKLHEELRAWAEQEMRSLNGQIEYVLRQALTRQKKSDGRGGKGPKARGDRAG